MCQRSFNKWNLPKKVVNETRDLEKHDLGKCSDNWRFCESYTLMITDMGEIFSTPSASNYGSLSPWRSPLTAVVGD